MKTYNFTVQDGRRLSGYRVEAESAEEAKKRFMDFMSFAGVIVCQEIVAEEEKQEGDPDDKS